MFDGYCSIQTHPTPFAAHQPSALFCKFKRYLPAWKELFMMQVFLLKGRMLAITAKIVNSEV